MQKVVMIWLYVYIMFYIGMFACLNLVERCVCFIDFTGNFMLNRERLYSISMLLGKFTPVKRIIFMIIVK